MYSEGETKYEIKINRCKRAREKSYEVRLASGGNGLWCTLYTRVVRAKSRLLVYFSARVKRLLLHFCSVIQILQLSVFTSKSKKLVVCTNIIHVFVYMCTIM